MSENYQEKKRDLNPSDAVCVDENILKLDGGYGRTTLSE